ncbi:hypothetical protein FOA43_002045 [Brettanomyces nanus]|uniref:Autophagy-related protein 9 n=1 Tax=Eeniella nana TaxID=13502 RepID=A0A875S3S2_EENNA|nr:uncharacterized protein FOA43_002045 [Brettanomyces nanus]QPG74712.1 hypothetical protein FOA43_002045 [Brettanomyces nanus]
MSGDLPKPTFLSRIFGANSNPGEDPLLNDDNIDLQYGDTSLESTQSRQSSSENAETTNEVHLGHSAVIQSASDSSASSDEGSVSSSASLRRFDPQKQAIRDQIQSEYEENMLDVVPQSLLMDEGKVQGRKSAVPLNQNITGSHLGSRLGEKALEFARSSIQFTHRRRDDEETAIEMRSLGGGTGGLTSKVPMLSPTERALWIWSNVTNLDRFLQDVYRYYIGNGLQCIILTQTCDLAIIVFVVWLSSFMGNCIDYDKLLNGGATSFDQVRVDKCYSKISLGQKCFYYILLAVLAVRVRNCIHEFKDFREIKLFFNCLLGISDDELQTISWPSIVKKIMILRDQNTNALASGRKMDDDDDDDLKSKKRLNAHDIANRLMRKDNYMIALFNKQVLDTPLKLPLLDSYFLTKTLEWNLKLCIFDYLFDTEGQLKKSVLSEHSRLSLSHNLGRRFQMAGLFSIVLTPALNFLNFEITSGHTVLFYMSAFGALFTICKSSILDDNSVFDPEASLRYVAQFTHYLPSSWEGQYHTENVRSQFCRLFNLKVVLVLKELTSMIMLPYLLYFRLPDASEKILDFFREFTIHVDGLGYVCSFAMFNLDDNKDKPGTMYIGRSGKWDREELKSGYYAANDDKMVKSYLYFLESYGEPVTKRPQAHVTSTPRSTSTTPAVRRRQLDHMEDTTAGLSTDSKNYLNNARNSMLLGDSVHTQQRNEAKLADSGGVLGLLNQIYKHQPRET